MKDKRALHNLYLIILLLACGTMMSSCNSEDQSTPKPKGYFRIAFPKKKYTTYDGDCPFTFQYPTYAKVVKDNAADAQPCWLNVIYPQFKATLHLSYKHVNHNVDQYIEECRTLAIKHEIKASAINQNVVIRDSSKVYGLTYDIEGNAASAYQFYLTDSTTHFLRGALYFFAPPNSDSLAPVVKFIKLDIRKMIETLQWKKED